MTTMFIEAKDTWTDKSIYLFAILGQRYNNLRHNNIFINKK